MPKHQTVASAVIILSLPLGNASAVAVKEAKRSQNIQLRGRQLREEVVNNATSSLSARSLDRELACVSNEWHVDFTKMTGHWCSNSLSYPESMKSETNMLHPSAKACCDHFFANDNCQVNKVCETEGAVNSSSQATFKSKPTGRPTPKPSPKPTKPLIQYYSIPNSGLCAPVDNKTPSWIDEFYTDWTQCCKVGWVFEKCMQEAPPDAIASPLTKTTTTSTTTSISLVYYYSSPSTGMCTPVDESTPSWVEEYYTDWTTCCKVGWVFEDCMKEAPPGAVSVTESTSAATPKILYYAIPTTGLCELVGEGTPSWMGESDFFESFSSCCKKSWNTDPCLAHGVSLGVPTQEPTIQEAPAPSSKPSISEQDFVPSPTFMPSLHPITEQPISSEPTRNPTLIASYQTSCDASPWHPSSDYSMCSNSADYDTSWDDPSLSSTYLHKKLSDCCAAFFDAWGKDCIVHDVCSTSPPTKSPHKQTDSPTVAPSSSFPSKNPSTSPTTVTPTSHPTTTRPSKSPTNTPTVTPIKYYVVFSTGMCTPLDAFTPYWMTESDFFVDYSKCCESSWNSDACLAISPSAQPTTANPSSSPTSRPSLSPTSTHPTINPTTSPPVSKTASFSNAAVSSENTLTSNLRSWHPSEDYTICTNSLDFPDSWSIDPYKEIFLHDTKEGCCEVFFESWGRDCKTEDISDISICNSAPWHPSEDYSKCTNAFGYEDSWNHPPLKYSYLYESSEDCCDTFFVAWGKECIVEDICSLI